MSKAQKRAGWMATMIIAALVAALSSPANAEGIPDAYRGTYIPGGTFCEPNGCINSPCCTL